MKKLYEFQSFEISSCIDTLPVKLKSIDFYQNFIEYYGASAFEKYKSTNPSFECEN
jgi:hypothetical protein